MTKEQFKNLSYEEQIYIWNDFAIENSWETQVYENNEYFFKDFYNGNAYELARHIYYGEYDFNDDYLYYDTLGRLNSFSDMEDFYDIIDIDEMLVWFNEINNESEKE